MESIRECNPAGRCTHRRYSNGYEEWSEYDSDGNWTHFRDSDGDEWWRGYDAKGNCTHYHNSDGDEWWRESVPQEVRDTYHELVALAEEDKMGDWLEGGE